MKPDFFSLGIAAIIIIIIAAIAISSFRSPANQPAAQYQADQETRPQLEISQTSFDMARVKMSETKTHSLTIKNIGAEPLDIRNFSTSCGCTSVQIEINGEKSPQFSMHNNPSWNKELQSSQTAQLLITYNPSIHPAKGNVSRSVYFQTNDPDNPEVEIKFNVFVED